MKKIEWDPKLELGVEEVDSQHKNLLEIANRTILLSASKNADKKDIKSLIDDLRKYTLDHFKSEEKFMEKIGYPKLEEHRHAHRQLTAQVQTYQRDLFHSSQISPADLKQFIKNWLIKHILGEDLKIKKFLEQKKE